MHGNYHNHIRVDYTRHAERSARDTRARAIAFARAVINAGGYLSPTAPQDVTAALHAVDMGLVYPMSFGNDAYGYRANVTVAQLDEAAGRG